MYIKEFIRDITLSKILDSEIPKDVREFLSTFENITIKQDDCGEVFYFTGSSDINIEYDKIPNILWCDVKNSERIRCSYDLDKREISELIKYALSPSLIEIGLTKEDFEKILVIP